MADDPIFPNCYIRLESSDFATGDIQIKTVTGRERLGELFDFEILFVAKTTAALDEATLLNTGVTLAFDRSSDIVRRLHGRIYHVRRAFDTTQDFDTFTVRIGPHLRGLGSYTGQEIYLNMTVPEIIVMKLKTAGLEEQGTDFELHLSDTYSKRDFVVQYAESDLAFIHRLAEHEGITIFYEHGAAGAEGWDPLAETGGVDKIVLADNQTAFYPIVGAAKVPFDETGKKQDIYALAHETAVVPRLYWVRDYNYEKNDHDLYGQAELDLDGSMGAMVEFGPNVTTDAEAKRLAKIRMEEQRVRQSHYEGESDVMRLGAGSTFTLENVGESGKELLVIEVEHRAELTALTSGGSGEEIDYRNRFVAVDAAHTFRPARLTPKPRIHGVMSGVVRTQNHEKGDTLPTPPVGAIDTQGRYYVELHLDTPGRDASHQGSSGGGYGGVLASLPIRMSQPSVGRDYGMHMPLRAGTEVAVAFVGGDPDRPLIIGAVPNGTTANVVSAVDSNKSRIKTQSGVIIQFSDA